MGMLLADGATELRTKENIRKIRNMGSASWCGQTGGVTKVSGKMDESMD